MGKGPLKVILRASLAVILVLALLAPVLGAKEKRGANLVVTKKDGTTFERELLAADPISIGRAVGQLRPYARDRS